MTTTTYHVGDVWEPEVTVTNAKTGAVGKPGSITFTVLKPNGQRETITTTELSTGFYEPQVPLTEPGIWRLSVRTTAPLEASQPGEITVEPVFG